MAVRNPFPSPEVNDDMDELMQDFVDTLNAAVAASGLDISGLANGTLLYVNSSGTLSGIAFPSNSIITNVSGTPVAVRLTANGFIGTDGSSRLEVRS